MAAVGSPDLVSLFAAVSVAATAWNQFGRHEELSKSYGATAQDLGLLRVSIEVAEGKEAFGREVNDAEATISNEYTIRVGMARRG